VTLYYRGGRETELKLTPGASLEIGDQAVPVANIVELRLEHDDD